MELRVEANIERWRGFAEAYDRHRPAPPSVLLDWISRYTLPPESRQRVVIDLGCGTGLSTFPWANRAALVIGVEPSDDMLRVAAQRRGLYGYANVVLVGALSTATGLPNGCADIVTCSQSLHWLEPEPTFAEIARILRPGGVFAAYDYDWPPSTGVARVDAAYDRFMAHASSLERSEHIPLPAHLYPKHEHLERMRASKRFAFVREIVMHSEAQGDAERFIGLTLTQGAPATLRKLGVTDDALGVPAFVADVRNSLGSGATTWLIGYRVRLGVSAGAAESPIATNRSQSP
jgi:SAM-dependent methyltransferase